jgi:anti-sigma factor ChrR (cupin superfamily)
MAEIARIPAFEARLDLEQLSWRETARPGVSWILISPSWEELRARTEGEPDGGHEVVALIRMQPGCGYPAHRHLGPEEVLVLQGGYTDAEGEHRAGTWIRYSAGSWHAPVALGDPEAPEGEGNLACVLFATARGGVELLEEAPRSVDEGN